jgi:hypothetical protein
MNAHWIYTIYSRLRGPFRTLTLRGRKSHRPFFSLLVLFPSCLPVFSPLPRIVALEMRLRSRSSARKRTKMDLNRGVGTDDRGLVQ